MNHNPINMERIRAALQSAERRVRDILTALESNDLDDQAMASRIREVERDLRRLARAA